VIPIDIDKSIQDTLRLPDEDGFDDAFSPEDPDVLEGED